MARFGLYLDVRADGACLAHVLALPGLSFRAANRRSAIAAAPAAIREYFAWLRRHGEPAPAEADLVEVDVAEAVPGDSAGRPGDRAALFGPDRESLSRFELERRLRLAEHGRADLLELAGRLAEPVLDWRADEAATTIREVLRHVGDAEQWYVSRIVDPATLPPAWAHDADMPIWDFLRMERRTAIDRLRLLTDAELAAIVVPTAFVDRPGEVWTANKALRRLLEHQLEHTGHVREILDAWRAQ